MNNRDGRGDLLRHRFDEMHNANEVYLNSIEKAPSEHLLVADQWLRMPGILRIDNIVIGTSQLLVRESAVATSESTVGRI